MFNTVYTGLADYERCHPESSAHALACHRALCTQFPTFVSEAIWSGDHVVMLPRKMKLWEAGAGQLFLLVKVSRNPLTIFYWDRSMT